MFIKHANYKLKFSWRLVKFAMQHDKKELIRFSFLTFKHNNFRTRLRIDESILSFVSIWYSLFPENTRGTRVWVDINALSLSSELHVCLLSVDKEPNQHLLLIPRNCIQDKRVLQLDCKNHLNIAGFNTF